MQIIHFDFDVSRSKFSPIFTIYYDELVQLVNEPTENHKITQCMLHFQKLHV